MLALHARSSRFALGTSRGLWPQNDMAHSLLYVYAKNQLSKWSGLRDICDIAFAPSAERARHKAPGPSRGLRPRQSMAHGSICLRAKIQPSKWSGLRDISKFVISRFVPYAEHKAQTEAFGLSKGWPTIQSVCVPKISPLGGPVSEILADVTFVTDGRTDTH